MPKEVAAARVLFPMPPYKWRLVWAPAQYIPQSRASTKVERKEGRKEQLHKQATQEDRRKGGNKSRQDSAAKEMTSECGTERWTDRAHGRKPARTNKVQKQRQTERRQGGATTEANNQGHAQKQGTTEINTAMTNARSTGRRKKQHIAHQHAQPGHANRGTQ